jgi:hypothetical protein
MRADLENNDMRSSRFPSSMPVTGRILHPQKNRSPAGHGLALLYCRLGVLKFAMCETEQTTAST